MLLYLFIVFLICFYIFLRYTSLNKVNQPDSHYRVDYNLILRQYRLIYRSNKDQEDTIMYTSDDKDEIMEKYKKEIEKKKKREESKVWKTIKRKDF